MYVSRVSKVIVLDLCHGFMQSVTDVPFILPLGFVDYLMYSDCVI